MSCSQTPGGLKLVHQSGGPYGGPFLLTINGVVVWQYTVHKNTTASSNSNNSNNISSNRSGMVVIVVAGVLITEEVHLT